MRVKQEENLDPAWVQDGLRALGRSLLTSRGVEGNDEIDPTRKAFLIHHKSPGQVDVSLGQLQNIVVVKLPPRAKETLFRAYGVICGNRRVAAAKLVNKESEKELIPVLNATILEVTDQQWNDQLIRFKFQLIAYTENNARQEMDAPERIYWLGMLRESYETLFPDSKKPGRSLPKTPNAVLPPEKSPRFDVLIKEMLHRSDSTTRADGKYFHQMSRTIFEWWHAMGLNVVAADEIITIPKPLQGRIREQIEARGLDPTLENIRKIIADEELRQEAKTQQPTIDRLCPEAVKEWWDKERLPFDAAEVLAQVPRIHQPKVLAAIPDDEPATQALITEIVEGNAVIQAAFQLERARAGLEPKVFEWYQANNLPYTVAERFFRIPIAMQPKIMETLKIQLADAVRQARGSTHTRDTSGENRRRIHHHPRCRHRRGQQGRRGPADHL
jgi:hypothetical protein